MSPTRIYVARHDADAEIVKDLLLHAGIEAHVVPVDSTRLRFATLAVWVARDGDVDRARAILAEHDQAPLSNAYWSWRCAECGEDIEEQFDRCWNCGASRRDGGTQED